MSSRTEEKGIANLANCPPSLSDLLKDADVQRMIRNAMTGIIHSGPIPDSASMLPTRPSPAEPPPVRGTGWAKDQGGLEMPLGQSGQDGIAEICDHFLGPAVKPKKV